MPDSTSNSGSADPIVLDKYFKKKQPFPLSRQNPWNTVLGDCSVVDEYLLDKDPTDIKWAPLHYVNTFLRAVGQVRECLF